MKYIKYLNYLFRHKWFVFVECFKVTNDWRYKIRLAWLGIFHDWSKFRLSEFIPYARYFYGDYLPYSKYTRRRKLHQEDINMNFDYAWLLHIHRNKHHWQHWLLQEDDGDLKNMPIPIKYMLEMVADWKGAGRAINGKINNEYKESINTWIWYQKNKHNINLNNINRKFIEKKIEL